MLIDDYVQIFFRDRYRLRNESVEVCLLDKARLRFRAASGAPRVFISHGQADEVLPIDLCSREIVPALRRRGDDVTYREFAGGHTVSPRSNPDLLSVSGNNSRPG